VHIGICSASVFDPFPPGRVAIELGSGLFGSKRWRLMYDPEGPVPPDEHHITGPMVVLCVGDRGGGGRLPQAPLPEPLGRPHLFVRSLDLPAHVYGPVELGFDRVHVYSLNGPMVEATVVDCTDHLPFNFYVAEIRSQVQRVMADGPEGRTVSWTRDNAD
jgi:hypothetical protein